MFCSSPGDERTSTALGCGKAPKPQWAPKSALWKGHRASLACSQKLGSKSTCLWTSVYHLLKGSHTLPINGADRIKGSHLLQRCLQSTEVLNCWKAGTGEFQIVPACEGNKVPVGRCSFGLRHAHVTKPAPSANGAISEEYIDSVDKLSRQNVESQCPGPEDH